MELNLKHALEENQSVVTLKVQKPLVKNIDIQHRVLDNSFFTSSWIPWGKNLAASCSAAHCKKSKNYRLPKFHKVCLYEEKIGPI
jgi:hypothetical protein